MFKDSKVFSGFSVDDQAAAKKFYEETLGLGVTEEPAGLMLNLATGGKVFVYAKDGHTPASFTILNFPVEDIDKGVAYLKSKGVTLEQYENMHQDEDGIARGLATNDGPDIAWFKDPAGNILAILQNS